MGEIKNFVDNIHNEAYRDGFASPVIGADSLIMEGNREEESLNGLWNFTPDLYDNCLRAKWFLEETTNEEGRTVPLDYAFDDWDTIPVPSVFNLTKPEYFYYEGPAVYSRRFAYVNRGEKRVFLRFGAVAGEARVFLNGAFLGVHKGGSTPFCVEATDHLRAENRLVVVADDTRRKEDVPSLNTDWFPYGGIYREVTVMRLPEVYVKELKVRLVGREERKFTVEARLGGISCEKISAAREDWTDKNGAANGLEESKSGPDSAEKNETAFYEGVFEIRELGIRKRFPFGPDGRGTITAAAPDMELWCPENPRLYDIALTVYRIRSECGEEADGTLEPAGDRTANGEPDRMADGDPDRTANGGADGMAGGESDRMIDRVTDRIGFRTIETSGRSILLNGSPLFLRGVCLHEDSRDHGKAVTKEEILEAFRLAKEMNCNFLRLAHYPHTEWAARLADEEGLLLWEEIPVYWWIDFANPETLFQARNQLAEMVRRDQNRASVIIWSVGNENPDTDERYHFMADLAEYGRKLDPTRLISAACLVDTVDLRIADRLEAHLDVIGLNEYYGWYDPDYTKLGTILEHSAPEKPVIITEFGADGAFEAADDRKDVRGSVAEQAEIYRNQIAMFKKTPYIQGTTPWILFDFRTPKRLGKYQKGYNIKGLIAEDRARRKPAFGLMQKFYEEVRNDECEYHGTVEGKAGADWRGVQEGHGFFREPGKG